MLNDCVLNGCSMLKRRLEIFLSEWKREKGHKPLVIKGVRQCGKTFIALEFARKNYAHVVYVNFVQTPKAAMAFENSLEVDNIIMQLSTVVRGAEFAPAQTCIILDEIQECPQARTALKFFHLDGRFDVIATGSLLGVKGYGKKSAGGGVERPRSIPVGYEEIVTMYPLDFEEFLWANGISEAVIKKLKKCFADETPIPDLIHQQMKELLLQYCIVGGMPEAVNAFIDTHNLSRVRRILLRIIDEYEDDMVKYAPDSDKPHIRQCFESIPKQMAKENKKFQYSLVQKGGRASKYEGSLQWIEDAGIIRRCYNLDITGLPLEGNAKLDSFKVYTADIGIFVSMLEDDTQFDILNGNLSAYKGAIYENLMADILGKMGKKLYYFHKDSGLEVDFVLKYKRKCTIVEVKAKGGKTKSAKTILNHPEKYGVEQCLKFGDYNIGRSEKTSKVLTLPFYIAFLLYAEP